MKLNDRSRHKGYYGVIFYAKRDTAYNFGIATISKTRLFRGVLVQDCREKLGHADNNIK